MSSLFGRIASIEDILSRLPQLQLQVEKLENEREEFSRRGNQRASFSKRCHDLSKQVDEQRQKLENTKGGASSSRAAAALSLDDFQRRLNVIAPERSSVSRSSASSSTAEATTTTTSAMPEAPPQRLPPLGGRRPSMYDEYPSDESEGEEKTAVLPAVTEEQEDDEQGTPKPPQAAPRRMESQQKSPIDDKTKVNVARSASTAVPPAVRKSPSPEQPVALPPRATSPGVVDGNRFVVLADLVASEPGDLTIRKGQTLTIKMTRSDGWWTAENAQGQQGLVPKTYLRHVAVEEIGREMTKEDEERKGIEEEQRRIESERAELDQRRREIEESGRALEAERRRQQEEVTREQQEERRRQREEELAETLMRRPRMIEDSHEPRPNVSQVLAVPLKAPVTCVGDALRSDPHLTYACHLTPRLSHSNLAFHDLFWNYEDDKLRKRRVRVCRIIRLVRLESMPNADCGLVRAALYDMSKKTGRQLVSNVHTIRAQIKNGTWSFITRTDTVSSGVELSDFVVRSNYRMVDVVLLMEASIIEAFEGGFREKSLGIVKIPIMGHNGESSLINKTYSEYLLNENIFQKNAETRKTSSRMYFKVLEVPNDLVHFVDSMPDVLLFNPMFVRLMYFFRRRAGTVLIRDRDNYHNAEMVSDPLLAVFPTIADQQDIMDLMRTLWTAKIRSMKNKPEKELAATFFQVFMNTAFCVYNTAIMPDYVIWDKNALAERQRVFTKCVEMLREYKSAARFLSTVPSRPLNIFDYSFDLLGPHALD